MLALDDLLKTLGYADSPFYRNRSSELQPETAHLFRAAFSAQVEGIYVFKSSPIEESTSTVQRTLPYRPVVYLAVANTPDEAREIHRKLWNLGSAPFIIVKLPNQIRAYTGFEYSHENEEIGKLDTVNNRHDLSRIIDALSATAIDTGKLWDSSIKNQIDDTKRVDRKLLENLMQLGNILKKNGLTNDIAHSLIGKYVYFNYLRDRNILTDVWLNEQQIDADRVFSSNATLTGLRDLTQALEARFNGQIFPIDFDNSSGQVQDKHVAWVAAVFRGGVIHSNHNLPSEIVQLHLPFNAYDFSYIPVETLSTIYEQFIDERKEIGAVYTPEYLADYVLSEVEGIKPLYTGGKILDPSCGSGVFLVLVYRRLIEKEMLRLGKKLSPEVLKQILVESIYGVERERDACFVTEFSLILTLLHYVEPPELEKLEFRFPELHNQHILHGDFFDIKGETGASIWQRNLRFDWIVGNPPWTKDLHPMRDKFALDWIKTKEFSVSGSRVAEAFSWLVIQLLSEEGVIGLLMPATSLFNTNSRKYRQEFFTRNEVLRITNFANLREVLFGKGKSSVLPAATFIYRPARNDAHERSKILHYGPFVINQVANVSDHPWTITINENEIQLLSATDATKGDTSFWKFALWGNHLDKDVIGRIEYMFSTSLANLCKKHRWNFFQGSELRSSDGMVLEEIKSIPWLGKTKRFNTKALEDSPYRHSIDSSMLEDIPANQQYIRRQGGEKGLSTTYAPHIILSPVWGRFIVYSDKDFVLPARQIGIAVDQNEIEDVTHFLKAITVFLHSSIAAYYLFFQAPQWGVFRNARLVTTKEVGNIRVPDLTSEQATEIAQFHDQFVEDEKNKVRFLLTELAQEDMEHRLPDYMVQILSSNYEESSRERKRRVTEGIEAIRTEIQRKIDQKIFEVFEVPEDVQLLVLDFMKIRLALDTTSKLEQVTRPPGERELQAYAKVLQEELNAFVMGAASHSVIMSYSNDLIECAVQINREDINNDSNVVVVQKNEQTKEQLMSQLRGSLREKISQWVYVQRSLRLFDGPRVFIYKSPRLIDWTRTQASIDAADIIGEVIVNPRTYEADYAHL